MSLLGSKESGLVILHINQHFLGQQGTYYPTLDPEVPGIITGNATHTRVHTGTINMKWTTTSHFSFQTSVVPMRCVLCVCMCVCVLYSTVDGK